MPTRFLHDSSGHPIVECLDPLVGGWVDEAGDPIGNADIQIDELVAAAPYRSVLSRILPPLVSTVWVVPPDDPTPPHFILQAFAEEMAKGLAALILATDPKQRDRAKRIITAAIDGQAGAA